MDIVQIAIQARIRESHVKDWHAVRKVSSFLRGL